MPMQKHFDKFNKNIYLTTQSEGYKKANDKDNSIYDEIKDEFKSQGYSVIETFKQGSFAVNTAIHSIDGDFDIDRAIVIDYDDAPDNPVKPKEVILKVLENRNFKDPLIKKPCVTADYKSVNLHIDYTVYRYNDGVFFKTYELAIGQKGSNEDNREWSDSDPNGLIDWIKKYDQYGEEGLAKRNQFRRIVRYLKRWRDVQFSESVRKKIFSIGLTIMVKNEYSPDEFSEELDNDLVELKKVVDNILDGDYIKKEWLKDNYRLHTELPVKPFRDVFSHKDENGIAQRGSDYNTGVQFKNKLNRLRDGLQEALDEKNEIKQCKILNKLFGDDFEVPKKISALKSAAIASSLPAAGASGTSHGA